MKFVWAAALAGVINDIVAKASAFPSYYFTFAVNYCRRENVPRINFDGDHEEEDTVSFRFFPPRLFIFFVDEALRR